MDLFYLAQHRDQWRALVKFWEILEWLPILAASRRAQLRKKESKYIMSVVDCSCVIAPGKKIVASEVHLPSNTFHVSETEFTGDKNCMFSTSRYRYIKQLRCVEVGVQFLLLPCHSMHLPVITKALYRSTFG
jgi:hypothetical protein